MCSSVSRRRPIFDIGPDGRGTDGANALRRASGRKLNTANSTEVSTATLASSSGTSGSTRGATVSQPAPILLPILKRAASAERVRRPDRRRTQPPTMRLYLELCSTGDRQQSSRLAADHPEVLEVGWPLWRLEKKFPGATKLMQLGQVFAGEQIFDLNPAESIDDVSVQLMYLFRLGIIRPIWYCPSHSRRAFRDLTHGPPWPKKKRAKRCRDKRILEQVAHYKAAMEDWYASGQDPDERPIAATFRTDDHRKLGIGIEEPCVDLFEQVVPTMDDAVDWQWRTVKPIEDLTALHKPEPSAQDRLRALLRPDVLGEPAYRDFARWLARKLQELDDYHGPVGLAATDAAHLFAEGRLAEDDLLNTANAYRFDFNAAGLWFFLWIAAGSAAWAASIAFQDARLAEMEVWEEALDRLQSALVIPDCEPPEEDW